MRAEPLGLGEDGPADAEQLQQADAGMTRVVSLSRLMNRPTLAGMTARSACGRTMYEVASGCATETDRLRGLDLAAGDRLQPAAHVLGDVRRA